MLRATTLCTFSTSQFSKMVRTWCVLYMFTSKRAWRHNVDIATTKVVGTCGVLYILTSTCASRQNGVHFFDISTPKSGPGLRCFVRFDFHMCFAPQWGALFRQLNSQRWPDPGLFCTFSLPDVLRATTACNFSSGQLAPHPPL